ncbi:hypothetical protein Tco_1222025 [Tanacetum coccineum]
MCLYGSHSSHSELVHAIRAYTGLSIYGQSGVVWYGLSHDSEWTGLPNGIKLCHLSVDTSKVCRVQSPSWPQQSNPQYQSLGVVWLSCSANKHVNSIDLVSGSESSKDKLLFRVRASQPGNVSPGEVGAGSMSAMRALLDADNFGDKTHQSRMPLYPQPREQGQQ